MGKHPIYCSTGVFVGRINNRDHTLLTRFGEKLGADGFEFLVMSVWYDAFAQILQEVKATGFSFPVLHSDKGIGDQLSFADPSTLQTALDLMKKNCEAAAFLGAKKIVVHPWGIPRSDESFDYICTHIGDLLTIAKEYGLDLLLENCCCKFHSPYKNLKQICKMHPDVGVIIDTRPAQFHRELPEICRDFDLIQNHVRHVHINDYHGGYMQWDALQPILHPGKGDVDFDAFFSSFKDAGYTGSFTLEAPSMRADTVAVDEINRNLDFIRTRI